MIYNFRFKALSIVIIFTTLFIFYNHNNSPEPSSETTQNQFQNTDKELLKAINLLNKEVFSIKEEIKDIKEDLAFQATTNYYDGQILPQTTGAVDNFNPYLPEEIIKSQQSTSSNNSNPTYEESKLEALELLNNTDIFDSIPDVDE